MRCTGRLAWARIGDLPVRLEEVHAEKLVADVSQVERMDTVGAWLIHRLVRDQGAEVVGADEDQALLLQQVAQSDQLVKVRPDRTPPLYRVLGQVGESTSVALRSLLGLLAFFGALLIATWNILKQIGRAHVI